MRNIIKIELRGGNALRLVPYRIDGYFYNEKDLCLRIYRQNAGSADFLIAKDTFEKFDKQFRDYQKFLRRY